MQRNTKPAEKSIVAALEFDTKTAKRVAYTEWEFTIVAPFEIEVCNASYGAEKADHTYRVMIDEQGVPVSCTCKGFKHYHQPNDRVGKHMLAIVAIGGETLLEAARAFSPQPALFRESENATLAEKVEADGRKPDTCPNGDPRCDGSDSDSLPCFDCFD